MVLKDARLEQIYQEAPHHDVGCCCCCFCLYWSWSLHSLTPLFLKLFLSPAAAIAALVRIKSPSHHQFVISLKSICPWFLLLSIYLAKHVGAEKKDKRKEGRKKNCTRNSCERFDDDLVVLGNLTKMPTITLKCPSTVSVFSLPLVFALISSKQTSSYVCSCSSSSRMISLIRNCDPKKIENERNIQTSFSPSPAVLVNSQIQN